MKKALSIYLEEWDTTQDWVLMKNQSQLAIELSFYYFYLTFFKKDRISQLSHCEMQGK